MMSKKSSLKSICVAHVIYSFGVGGLEKGISTLINYGSPDIKHIIISLTPHKESERLLQKDIKILTLDKPDKNSFEFIFKLTRLLRKIKPDIVHTRNWSGMDGIFAAKLAGITKIIHGEHGWDMFDPFGKNLKRKIIRQVTSAFVCKYTCVSRQLAGWLQDDVGVRKEIRQIYNGVNIRKLIPVDSTKKRLLRRRYKMPENALIIGSIGRLDAIKNHRLLIKTFQYVSKKYPRVFLVVVGDGPERMSLEKISDKYVRFLGTRSDVHSIFSCLDLFILPSLNEGISNTILEAMASGIPVIASNVGGNPELIQHGLNGFLSPPNDSYRLFRLIENYINNPELGPQHGKAGRKQAVTNFSIESMVKQYEDVYRNAAQYN